MDLTNTFDVPASIDETWAALTDIELIAPCMPGATLTEVEGDTYRGTVKVKVGPITATFKGTASFVDQDPEAHRAVLKASGRDTGGKGNANATITAQLTPADDGTHVSIITDLAISGKVAQFGRSAMADISAKLVGQFVDCLATTVLGPGVDEVAAAGAEMTGPDGGAGAGDPPQDSAIPDTSTSAKPTEEKPPTASAGPRRIESADATPIDLLETAGATSAKIAVPVALAVVLLVLWIIRRRR